MLGTRTFLFSDLREYTAFVERHGDAAARELIAEYRRIVRSEIARHDGAEIKTEGDSFYVVFAGVRAALAAAQSIVREAHRYTDGHSERPMRIGVGIHAGEPEPHEGQYVGAAVILAARLAQSAEAGEILVSDVARSLLPREGLPQMTERDGLVLKGVAESPRVYALRPPPPVDAAPKPAADVVAIPAADPVSRRILCPDMIGRERELAQLGTHLAEAQAGRGRTVLVFGEAGLGKSALIRRFSDRARDAGARVLTGECSEIEARRPFGPFVDALGHARIALPEELRAGAPGAQPVEEAQRYRVHAGFARELAAAAATTPLVLVIEDLHWADEASLELVPYLARKLGDQRLLLVATYRSDELHRTHPLNRTLADLARARLGEEVPLRRLSEKEQGDLVRRALGLTRAPTPEFRRALYERTEGNPFFCEEILRALVERGDLEYRGGAWHLTKEVPDLALPVSVRDAVERRLQGLPGETQRALQIAAVIGQRFDFDLLREVSGLDEAMTLAAVRDGVEAQLLVEDPAAGEDAYRFRHALSREAVLAELLGRERRLLHRAVGEALERIGSKRAEELAYHFDEARDPRAFRYRERAAAQAERQLAFARAVSHLERAIELAPDDDPTLGGLYLRLAEAAAAAGHDQARALRAAQAAVRLSRAAGDDLGTGLALHREAGLRWQFGDIPAARDLLAEAVRVLEPHGVSAPLAAAYAELARLAAVDARAEEAVALGERALALARETNAVDVEAAALCALGIAVLPRDEERSLEYLRQSLALALERNMVTLTQRVYQSLSACFARSGRWSEYDGLFPQRLAHAERFGILSNSLLATEADRRSWLGEWDEALEAIASMESGTIWELAVPATEAQIRIARDGPTDDIFARLEGARQRMLATRETMWVAQSGLPALPYLLAGRYDEAREQADAALAAMTPQWTDLIEQFAPLLLAALGRGDAAALDRWTAALVSPGQAPWAVPIAETLARAIAAHRDGRTEEALSGFRAAADLMTPQRPMRKTESLLRQFIAEMLAERGDLAGAKAELDRARAFWVKAKARWYLGEIDRWAAERGIA